MKDTHLQWEGKRGLNHKALLHVHQTAGVLDVVRSIGEAGERGLSHDGKQFGLSSASVEDVQPLVIPLCYHTLEKFSHV